MAVKTDLRMGNATEAQETYFDITEKVPEEAWYWAAIGAIFLSLLFFIQGRRDWSLFVSQWSPTFLLLGLFHKLLKPSRS